MNKICALALLLLCTGRIQAQDFQAGIWTLEEVNKNSSSLDSNANAEVLRELA
jgi:hypothetical protein